MQGIVCRNPPDGLSGEGEYTKMIQGNADQSLLLPCCLGSDGNGRQQEFFSMHLISFFWEQFILIFYLKHQNDTQSRRLSAGFLSLCPEREQSQSPQPLGSQFIRRENEATSNLRQVDKTFERNYSTTPHTLVGKFQ